MGGPEGYGRAYEDTPTMPAMAPVRAQDPDSLGIPGLDYLPRPEAPPPAAPAHRRSRSRPPWALLTAAAALAVLVALALVWTIGGRTDSTGPAPTAPAATEVLPSAGDSEPSPAEPSPTVPEFTTSPPPSPSVTVPPAPSATTVAPPPGPAPRLVRVPGVVGERRSSAETTLRRAGFAVSVRLVRAPTRPQVRRVVAQLPGAGQLARRGSVVVLLVGAR